MALLHRISTPLPACNSSFTGRAPRVYHTAAPKLTKVAAVRDSDAGCPAEDLPSTSAATRRALLVGLATAAAATATPTPASAKLVDYLLNPDDTVQEVSMVLGTPDNQYVFTPSTMEFIAGKVYKLKLTNPSQLTHYFTALEFADKIYTILVLTGDPAVEVKGAVKEVALKAGASATWIFIPIKPGKYPLRCTVKGHDAMMGQLIVKRA